MSCFARPNTHPALARQVIHAVLLCSAAVQAQASVLPFSAEVNGLSQITGIVDPIGPVVSVQTQASGNGSPGPWVYHSADHINLATGQGSGSNRFIAADGDELFGGFVVQMIPGADASLFDLIGEVFFTGGTGDFAGATGHASFTGDGQFFSATEARTHFVFGGRVITVDEPGSGVLGALALGLGWARKRRPVKPSRAADARPSHHTASPR